MFPTPKAFPCKLAARQTCVGTHIALTPAPKMSKIAHPARGFRFRPSHHARRSEIIKEYPKATSQNPYKQARRPSPGCPA